MLPKLCFRKYGPRTHKWILWINDAQHLHLLILTVLNETVFNMVHALAFLKKNTHFSYFFRLTQGPCSYIYTLKARQWSGSHKGPQAASLFLNRPWLLYALSLCFCFLVVGLFSCSCQHTTCLQYSFLLPYQLPFPIHNRPGVSVSYCCVTNHLKKHSGFKQQAIYCCSCVLCASCLCWHQWSPPGVCMLGGQLSDLDWALAHVWFLLVKNDLNKINCWAK